MLVATHAKQPGGGPLTSRDERRVATTPPLQGGLPSIGKHQLRIKRIYRSVPVSIIEDGDNITPPECLVDHEMEISAHAGRSIPSPSNLSLHRGHYIPLWVPQADVLGVAPSTTLRSIGGVDEAPVAECDHSPPLNSEHEVVIAPQTQKLPKGQLKRSRKVIYKGVAYDRHSSYANDPQKPVSAVLNLLKATKAEGDEVKEEQPAFQKSSPSSVTSLTFEDSDNVLPTNDGNTGEETYYDSTFSLDCLDALKNLGSEPYFDAAESSTINSNLDVSSAYTDDDSSSVSSPNRVTDAFDFVVPDDDTTSSTRKQQKKRSSWFPFILKRSPDNLKLPHSKAPTLQNTREICKHHGGYTTSDDVVTDNDDNCSSKSLPIISERDKRFYYLSYKKLSQQRRSLRQQVLISNSIIFDLASKQLDSGTHNMLFPFPRNFNIPPFLHKTFANISYSPNIHSPVISGGRSKSKFSKLPAFKASLSAKTHPSSLSKLVRQRTGYSISALAINSSNQNTTTTDEDDIQCYINSYDSTISGSGSTPLPSPNLTVVPQPPLVNGDRPKGSTLSTKSPAQKTATGSPVSEKHDYGYSYSSEEDVPLSELYRKLSR